MKRAIMGAAVIVAVVAGCLLSASPAGAADGVRECPPVYTLQFKPGDAADRNGDGYICRRVIRTGEHRKHPPLVTDNNVFAPG